MCKCLSYNVGFQSEAPSSTGLQLFSLRDSVEHMTSHSQGKITVHVTVHVTWDTSHGLQHMGHITWTHHITITWGAARGTNDITMCRINVCCGKTLVARDDFHDLLPPLA